MCNVICVSRELPVGERQPQPLLSTRERAAMSCRGFAPYSVYERACLGGRPIGVAPRIYPSLKDMGGFFIAIFEGG